MKAEKERKFNETLFKILYPPPPASHHQEEEEDESPTDPNANASEVDDLKDKCLSSKEEEECCTAFEKLTRAQRKKIRRKKLKEAASEPRKEMIGPLLPSTIEIGSKSSSIQESNTADTIKFKKNKRRMAKRGRGEDKSQIG